MTNRDAPTRPMPRFAAVVILVVLCAVSFEGIARLGYAYRHEMVSPKALNVGHLPYFTENPFVLAKLTERLNVALRGLAERRGFGLIDFEAWSIQALQPRDIFFRISFT